MGEHNEFESEQPTQVGPVESNAEVAAYWRAQWQQSGLVEEGAS